MNNWSSFILPVSLDKAKYADLLCHEKMYYFKNILEKKKIYS